MRNPYQMGFDYPTEDSIYYPNPQAETLTDYRFLREVRELLQLRSPTDAACYFREHVFNPFEAFTQEEMWVLMLNTRLNVTHDAMVYRGTLSAVPVRTADIFRPAIYCNAGSILLAHCHPSGDPTPSPEDISCTQELVRAGQLLDIQIVDHLVVGKESWISLKEKGLGF